MTQSLRQETPPYSVLVFRVRSAQQNVEGRERNQESHVIRLGDLVFRAFLFARYQKLPLIAEPIDSAIVQPPS